MRFILTLAIGIFIGFHLPDIVPGLKVGQTVTNCKDMVTGGFNSLKEKFAK